MAIADELNHFVKESLALGTPRPRIESVLREAGWPEEHVHGALRGFAEVDFAIPVPRPRPYLSAREAFLYLVLFSSLYLSAFHLGSLVFQLIDLMLPDPALPEGAARVSRDLIRWSISFLVVAFPVYLYVARLTNREVREDPSKRASAVRRWLTYLTLFIASSVLVGDIVALVHSLLGGDLALRFVLKVATIALIAGGVFWHYLRDIGVDADGTP